MFERLRAAIDAALDAATAPADKRDIVSGMRDAVIEAHAALGRAPRDMLGHHVGDRRRGLNCGEADSERGRAAKEQAKPGG